MLDRKKKLRIIESYKKHGKDTGSTEVQVAILSAEIEELTQHLREHRHDFSSRRGLFRKVGQRRRLLRYLEREDSKSFEEIVAKLKIKISRRTEQLAELEELIKFRDEEASGRAREEAEALAAGEAAK